MRVCGRGWPDIEVGGPGLQAQLAYHGNGNADMKSK
jgi:hypothetical protein